LPVFHSNSRPRSLSMRTLSLEPSRLSSACSPVISSLWLLFHPLGHSKTQSFARSTLITCRRYLVACCTRPALPPLFPRRLEIRPFRSYSHTARPTPHLLPPPHQPLSTPPHRLVIPENGLVIRGITP
jgi:hypothetical protein